MILKLFSEHLSADGKVMTLLDWGRDSDSLAVFICKCSVSAKFMFESVEFNVYKANTWTHICHLRHVFNWMPPRWRQPVGGGIMFSGCTSVHRFLLNTISHQGISSSFIQTVLKDQLSRFHLVKGECHCDLTKSFASWMHCLKNASRESFQCATQLLTC